MDWTRKKVLVTGAGGFIGSHLTEHLLALGAEATALVRYGSLGSRGWLDSLPIKNELNVVAGDIRDPDSIEGAFSGVDVVFHLAALIGIPYSYTTPLAYARTNVEGTVNVLQAARDAGVERVVHTSTSEVYGSARHVPINETHPLQGQSPYSASKIGADKIVEAFHLTYGLPVTTIRPFNTYGPRQSSRAIVPTIITQALTGDELKLGSLSPTRDLNYVLDTVSGFVSAAEREQAVGQVVNVGSGRETSVGDLAAIILGLVGRDMPIVLDDERVRPDNSEVERLLADNTLAKELLAWTPLHNLEEGLSQTIEWIKDHLEQFRVDAYVT